MADVMGEERGQLFILTALTLGVLFVALALLLNTAIFTENIATRSTDPGVEDAVAFRANVNESVGAVVVATNQRFNTSESTLTSNFQTELDNFSEHTLRQYSVAGHSPDISYTSVNEWGGQIIQDDSTRTFTDALGAENWTLVTGVDPLRSYNMTINNNSVGRADNPSPTTDDVFYVEVNGDGGTLWRLYAYDDTTSAEDHMVLDIRVDGSTDAVCTGYRPTATIDLYDGTANGSCSFTGLSTLSTPLSIEYVNGENVTGRYRIAQRQSGIVGAQDQEADIENGHYGDEETDLLAEPIATELIWSVNINVTYTGPDVYYAGEVTAEP